MPEVKADAEIVVEIEVWCACGNGLCGQSTGGIASITVEPCERCLSIRGEEEYERGYDAGRVDTI